jgi:hypothetical protein
MRHAESWKLYRDGPVPLRMSATPYWSCTPYSRHVHRWYVRAWICWWLAGRPVWRAMAWFVGCVVVVGVIGVLLTITLSPRRLDNIVWSPSPIPLPAPVVSAPPSAPAQGAAPGDLACLPKRLQGKLCPPQ